MNKRTVGVSEAIGCVVIYAAAVFLHYIYPLSGGSALGLLFGSVNESVWEHVKIITAAYAGWSLLQLIWLRVSFRRYVAAKCLGLYLLMGLIIGAYYIFKAILGGNVIWVDIVSSFLSVILVQVLTYCWETGENHLQDYFAPALLLTLYYLMFFSFTIFPPKAELFRDPVSGGFGVAERIVNGDG